MNQKVLITGGAGFVGIHLTHVLQEAGFEVTVFDKACSESKIEHGVSYIKGDITNLDELQYALQGIDIVVHLAAIVSVAVCEQDSQLCYKNNIEGTENVFKAAQQAQVQKIIYASSAAVYGNFESDSITESDPTHPISEYGKSKLENEKIAHTYAQHIPSIGLRFFNIYGPGLTMENAYPSVLIAFFKKIQASESLTVFGTGEQTRDFVHVLDVCQAILKSITSTHSNAVYNVGTGEQTTIKTLAELIQKHIPETHVSFEPKRDFDIEKSCADISKIKFELHYSPTHSVTEDIPDLIKTYIV